MDRTRSDGRVEEPALIYDAGERRTHAEHATEAYDSAQRADALQDMADRAEDEPLRSSRQRWATLCRDRAQWHATMAVYEALTQPHSRADQFDASEREVIARALGYVANLVMPIVDSPSAARLHDEFRT